MDVRTNQELLYERCRALKNITVRDSEWCLGALEVANSFSAAAAATATNDLTLAQNLLVAVSEVSAADDPALRSDIRLAWLVLARAFMEKCKKKSELRRQVTTRQPPVEAPPPPSDLFVKTTAKGPLQLDSYEYKNLCTVFHFAKNKFTKQSSSSTTELIATTSEICKMYDFLIYYETSDNRRRNNYLSRISKMQKRKLTLQKATLTAVALKEAEGSLPVAAAHFRVGEIYAEMLDTKMKLFERNMQSDLTPGLLQKMAFLCKAGVACFEAALAIYEGDAAEVVEEEVEGETAVEEVKVVAKEVAVATTATAAAATMDSSEKDLICCKAFFNLARLYNKFFTPNRKEQLEYTEKAANNYQVVVTRCREKPWLAEQMGEELKRAIDTADLLRRQIKKDKEETAVEIEDSRK